MMEKPKHIRLICTDYERGYEYAYNLWEAWLKEWLPTELEIMGIMDKALGYGMACKLKDKEIRGIAQAIAARLKGGKHE